MYLLDTNVIIALLKGNPAVTRAVRPHRPSELATSSIVLHELYFSAYKGDSRRAFNDLTTLSLEVLSFSDEDAIRAGEIRAYLQVRGTPIGPYDVLIAGQALARDLTLVTRNTSEFERVEGLRVENWEA